MSTYDRHPIDVAKDAIAFGEERAEEAKRAVMKTKLQLAADETALQLAEGYLRRWTIALGALVEQGVAQ